MMVIFVQPVSPVFALWIYLLFPLLLCFNPGALNISVRDCNGFTIKYPVRYCERKTRRQSRIQYFGTLPEGIYSILLFIHVTICISGRS